MHLSAAFDKAWVGEGGKNGIPGRMGGQEEADATHNRLNLLLKAESPRVVQWMKTADPDATWIRNLLAQVGDWVRAVEGNERLEMVNAYLLQYPTAGTMTMHGDGAGYKYRVLLKFVKGGGRSYLRLELLGFPACAINLEFPSGAAFLAARTLLGNPEACCLHGVMPVVGDEVISLVVDFSE